MLQIAINGRFLTQAVTGVQRYAWETIRAMDRLLAARELPLPDAPVEILAPPGTPPVQFDFFQPRRVGWSGGQIWEQTSLPFWSRGRLLFTPSGGSPLLHARHVFTLPDAGIFATPESFAPRYRAWYQRHHRWAVANAGLQLLTVSESSRRELQRWLPATTGRITVTPLGHEHALRPVADRDVLQRLGLKSRSYILGVGSANPNKNFATLLHAYARLRAHWTNGAPPALVVTGRWDARIFGETSLQQEGLVQTGYLADEALRALYENAACFVFPSTYEGFGLPPLEAMALGCPVICSDAASLPEVCGDAAMMVHPLDADGMADAMVRMLTEVALREEYVRRGLARAQLFRWEETARATWDVLLKAASLQAV